jgi:hypothetical protein
LSRRLSQTLGVMNTHEELAAAVREVFLIPPDFAAMSVELAELVSRTEGARRDASESFLQSLRGAVTTLSIPFQYTYSEVHSVQWQRFISAERIRARGNPAESEREMQAQSVATARMKEYFEHESGGQVANSVLLRLESIKGQPESLSAARELMRQGVVLIWSAFEVLSRDLFVDTVNRTPALVDRLLSHPVARKRFNMDKVDFATLARYSYNLSSSLGSLLIERTDIDDIQTIREAYGALYPENRDLNMALSEERLWHLFQKRNLIVHRRGVVDQHYLDRTGDKLPLGQTMWIRPSEIEDFLRGATEAGTKMVAATA